MTYHAGYFVLGRVGHNSPHPSDANSEVLIAMHQQTTAASHSVAQQPKMNMWCCRASRRLLHWIICGRTDGSRGSMTSRILAVDVLLAATPRILPPHRAETLQGIPQRSLLIVAATPPCRPVSRSLTGVFPLQAIRSSTSGRIFWRQMPLGRGSQPVGRVKGRGNTRPPPSRGPHPHDLPLPPTR